MVLLVSFSLFLPGELLAVTAQDYAAVPPFLTTSVPPLVMLVMGRNHKLYYEAYNDASDLNEDGVLDVGYKGEDEPFTDTNGNGVWDAEPTLTDTNGNGTWDPGEFIDSNGNGVWDAEPFTDVNGDHRWTKGIDYYGYFDSHKCYTYNDTGSQDTSLFEPSSVTPDKKCSGANEWSGDFLNYLTTSRMDALRKVLYGGFRDVDSATETILQRVYVPQDAHSWGKEYTSVAVDGYDISDYTPFSVPQPGLRHLFASTTLSDNGVPLLRYALNNTHRIWEWVSKESPVADNSIATTGGGHPGHPADHAAFESMVTTFATAANLFGSGAWLDYTIRNHVDQVYPSPSNSDFGAIDGGGNPWGSNYGYSDTHDWYASDQENYLAIFTGHLDVVTAGNYQIAVDGDDAVEVIIDGGTANERVIGYYGPHAACWCTSHSDTVYLTAGTHSIEFRMEEAGGGDRYFLYWNGPDSGYAWSIIPAARFTDLNMATYHLDAPASTIHDLTVRVKVCDPAVGVEDNCKQYPDGDYKPVGLLQRYGESDRMYFGLMTGSYTKNTAGGVLRKNISSIKDEIDPDTGQFSGVSGIIDTINNLRIAEYNYGSYSYNPGWPDAWVTTRPMHDGEFPDWGNPTGEIMYEALRYFAGKPSPTPAFDYTNAGSLDNALGLPKADWIDPYHLEDTNGNGVLDPGEDTNGNGKLDGYERCAKPFMLVLSDIYPTFDSDQVPGNIFNPSFTGDLTDSAGNNPINEDALATKISDGEGISGANYYIGQKDATYDGACTPKPVDNFGELRGLCPEEPTKQGSYTAAAVAYYGAKTDISASADGAQHVATYAVGLASPLPKINIKIRNNTVTLIPFAKSVGGCLGISNAEGDFQPTNTIVDFYVQEITPTRGVFRVNFEDVEQAADHDMDAIAMYEYQVNDNGTPSDPSDDTLEISMSATYASGCIIQHLGYIISGTTQDGIYLELRDADTDAGDDVDYFLDTPPGQAPGSGYNDGLPLPKTATRTFVPGTSPGATLLKNPLWYAAKWGGFEDRNTPTEDLNGDGVLSAFEDVNGNHAIDYTEDPVPDLKEEWDADSDGIPDSYFYVVNPLRLEEQLNKSFAAILNRSASGTAASVVSNSRSGEGAVYQSIFYPKKYDAFGHDVSWAGDVQALLVDERGNMREDHYDPEWYLPSHRTEPNPGRFQINLRSDIDRNGDGDCTDPDDVDYDGDGQCDKRDLIVLFEGDRVLKFDDVNENQRPDRDEDRDHDHQLDLGEDLNNNGILDPGEDVNGNGLLDASEDLNGNGYLDTDEDFNGNHKLDPGEDLNHNGELDTNEDFNGNRILDPGEDLNHNGRLDIIDETVWQSNDVSEALAGQIKYLWRASDWLNAIFTGSVPGASGSQIETIPDREDTGSLSDRRIFSFIDTNRNMVVDPGEQKEFVSSDPGFDDYLTLYSPALDAANVPQWVTDIRAAGNFSLFQQDQADRIINYIRGADQDLTGEYDIAGTSLPRMRSRQLVDPVDGVQKTWRLGDIIHSTPTVVGRPGEGYHLLYRDFSYADFVARYQKRRIVIYAGGNDGMIHAFNGGFYDGTSKTFKTALAEPFTDQNGDGVYTPGEPFIDWNGNGSYDGANQDNYALGAELWAYVPYNLLPHLYWLTEPGYPHVYFNDLKPRIFDARIFTPDNDHPNGWGTVMVVGMRFGGGKITADLNHNDTADPSDPTMSSAYVIFDITNPEAEPRVLAELSFARQGYTTCYPTAMPMENDSEHRWYLVFGSGPADANGDASPHPAPSSSDPDILTEAVSKQTAKLFVVDITELGTASAHLQYIDASGVRRTVPAAPSSPVDYYISELDSDAFVSDPIAVDYDLDFNTDVVYFGTVIGDDSSGWRGKLRRLLPLDDVQPSKWVSGDVNGDGMSDFTGTDSRARNTLIDLTSIPSLVGQGQPITAAPTIGLGDWIDFDGDGSFDAKNRWVFFGTGRFLTRSDAENVDQQSFYGIKEPWDASGFTWASVDRDANLLNTGELNVFDDESVRDKATAMPAPWPTWDDLLDEIYSTYDGWYINFEKSKERNIGQAVLLGDLLTFTTYRPSPDICTFEGESWLYALYYKSGTPYYKPVIGFSHNDFNGNGTLDEGEAQMKGKVYLGQGLAVTPNVHTGRQSGSTAFVQTSTGAVKTIEQLNPGMTKSGKASWMERR